MMHVSARITRRAMLAALPVSLSATTNPPTRKARPLPRAGEFVRFADPLTENTVVRLTNPASRNLLPAASNPFVSLKERFLIFSSDRAGSMSPFEMDLHTGTATLIAATMALDANSLWLDEQQRLVYFLDGGVLKEATLATKRTRVVAEHVTAFGRAVRGGFFVVVREGRLEILGSANHVLATEAGSWCLVRPGGKGCAFGRETGGEEREFWYVPFPDDPEQTKAVLLAKGRVSNPLWSPDGRSLLFLRDVPGSSAYLAEIREVLPETGEERCVDHTSQFAAFAANGDASVFVGASRSKAQPAVVLLLRTAQRELMLCEHRASHPAAVSPVFSPDSRRVYFQSDHEGKSALYSVNVELLVEPTPAI